MDYGINTFVRTQRLHFRVNCDTHLMRTMWVLMYCLILETVNSLQVFSSCTNVEEQNWIKGYGVPIKSWTKSLTPLDNASKLSHYLEGILNTEGHLESVKSRQIEWVKFGPYEHDGLLYSDTNKFTYIYDDFHTVIIGEFNDRKLESGHASKIIAYRCNNGIIELRFSQKVSLDVYSHESISEDLPPNPTLMDPLEKNQLFVAPSNIQNMQFSDGLFAKRIIPGKLTHYKLSADLFSHSSLHIFSANTLVAICSGQLQRFNKPVVFPNMTKEDIENIHKNYMNYNDEFLIDVPPSLTAFRKYRASLAHKVCRHLNFLFIVSLKSILG